MGGGGRKEGPRNGRAQRHQGGGGRGGEFRRTPYNLEIRSTALSILAISDESDQLLGHFAHATQSTLGLGLLVSLGFTPGVILPIRFRPTWLIRLARPLNDPSSRAWWRAGARHCCTRPRRWRTWRRPCTTMIRRWACRSSAPHARQGGSSRGETTPPTLNLLLLLFLPSSSSFSSSSPPLHLLHLLFLFHASV